MSEWLQIDVERAMYVDRGVTVIVCDRQIETGWQFCPSCGWQLVEDDELKEVTR